MAPKAGPFTREEFLRRFLSKVRFTDSCWLWTGAKTKQGYGILSWKKRTTSVTRLSYTFFNDCSRLSDELDVHHFYCENPSCVNPDHLEAKTKTEHFKIHHNRLICPRGHIRSAPGRCAKCDVLRQQKYRRKHGHAG